jgi:hypothetical protein
MGDTELLDDPLVATRRFTTRMQPRLIVIVAGVAALFSVAVCAAAILAPAPAAAVPAVVAVCVGSPLFAAWEAPSALAWVRAERSRDKALAKLRRTLDQLPEIEHPFGR